MLVNQYYSLISLFPVIKKWFLTIAIIFFHCVGIYASGFSTSSIALSGISNCGYNFFQEARPQTSIQFNKSNLTDFNPEIAIKNGSGLDHLIKIYNGSENCISMAYVRRDSSIKIELEPGNYIIKSASGSQWLNEIDFFGPKTVYSEYSTRDGKTFMTLSKERTTDGWNANGITLSLTKVVNGNVTTKTIKKDSF